MTRNRAIGVGRTPVPLGLTYGLMLAFLYLPIALLFLFSFNSNTVLSFPLQELTLDWYQAVFADEGMLEAARNSLVVGVSSATLATALGLAVSLAVIRFRFRGRTPLLGLAVLPLIVPFIVLAVSLFLLFGFIDVPRSLITIGAGHVVIALPFATLILLARLTGIDPALEDAAMDLAPRTRPRCVEWCCRCSAVAFVRLAHMLHRLVRRGGDRPLSRRRRPDLSGLPL